MTVLADPPAGRPDVAVVRQPIADERHAVVGYELLFGGERTSLDSATDAKATSALLVDAFGDIGLEVLAGRHPAWMSIARNFLMEIGPPPVRPDRAVLQIAAYAARDDLLAVLQQLGRSGYTLALDDFDGRSDVEPLLGLCSIVKVRVGDRDDTTLEGIIASPKMHGALLVATEVATVEDFDRCRALGFSYFQGDFFAKPRLVQHRSVGTGGISSLRALGELSAADASFEDLERIISSDVGLSLKLLRYPEERETLFTIGLFSVADALMDVPMEEVLESLPFSDEIRAALLRREGPKVTC